MISIIIPVYNKEKYIEETLQSVVKQTYSDFECIIVNDGSTDKTEDVVLSNIKKDNRFHYFTKENGGLSSARNFGLKYASNDIVLPLDADDLIHEDFIKEVLNVFRKSDALVVTFDVSFFGTKSGLYELPKYSYQKMLLQNCFIACSPFRKELINRTNGYDEGLKAFEDWDFWIRALDENSKIVKIPKVLYYYRKEDNSALTSRFKSDPAYYYSLYDYVYNKNRLIYQRYFPNPILAYQENQLLRDFNNKVKSTWLFKLYVQIKKMVK